MSTQEVDSRTIYTTLNDSNYMTPFPPRELCIQSVSIHCPTIDVSLCPSIPSIHYKRVPSSIPWQNGSHDTLVRPIRANRAVWLVWISKISYCDDEPWSAFGGWSPDQRAPPKGIFHILDVTCRTPNNSCRWIGENKLCTSGYIRMRISQIRVKMR